MKFFTQLKKVLLESVAGIPSDSSKSRIWYDSTANVVGYQDDIGATALVSKDRSQVLTKKTYDDEITFKQIAKPNNPSSGYNKIYPKSDDEFYHLKSDGTEVKLGAGGAGDADTIHLINVDDLKLSDIDLTGNNSSFDGGGTITASSLSLSTTAADLLTGDTVIKYLPAADGSNDYFGFTKSIPIGQRGTELGFQFNYKTTDDTEDEDFRFCVKIKDGASAGDISYYNIDEFYDSDNTGIIFSVSSFIPKDCTEIEFGWQNTDTTTTVGLYLSNILVSQDPFVYENFADGRSQIIRYDGYLSKSSDYVKFKTRQYNYDENKKDTSKLFSDDNTGAYTKITAEDECYFKIRFLQKSPSSAQTAYIERRNSAGTVLEEDWTYNTEDYGSSLNVVFYRMNKGDYIVAKNAFTPNDDSRRSVLQVLARPVNIASKHIVTPMTGPKWVDISSYVTATNWTNDYAKGYYWVDNNEKHMLKVNLSGTRSTKADDISIYLDGVTFIDTKNGIGQPLKVQGHSSGVDWKVMNICRATNNSNHFYINSYNGSFDELTLYCEVELKSRPTWADPVSSRYLAAVPSAIVTNYADASGQTLTSASNITWDTKIKDDNNLLNGSTGVWTASKDGTVNIAANVLVDSTTAALIGRFFTIALVKNSSLFLYGSRDFAYSTATRNYTSIISVNSIPVKKGDTLSIQPVYNIDTPSLYASQDSNSFSVVYNQ